MAAQSSGSGAEEAFFSCASSRSKASIRSPRSTESSYLKRSSGTRRMRIECASSRRRSLAASFSAFITSTERSGCNAVTQTVATSRSRVTSTSLTLACGSAWSRTSACNSAPSSRRNSALMRSVRWKEWEGIVGILETGRETKCASPKLVRLPSPFSVSQGSCHLDPLEALDLVAGLDVVVLLDADAALHAVAHFVDVLLEAAQRFQFALEDHHVVAQHADRLVALDHALDHHAAGDRAEFRGAEHVAHFGGAENVLSHFGTEQTARRLFHLIDHVVDDREVA